jgi:hypothetical protein
MLTGAELAGAELAEAVAAAALLAGPAADGLTLPGGELLQPAATPIRPANTAARTAAAPMVLSFLFMALLSIRFSVAWCHELFTEPRPPAVQQALNICCHPKPAPVIRIYFRVAGLRPLWG